eukprot:CAMPEP_0174914348 /NCGR_PEP_ID=MMETSP0167-20121228/80792_1 /TAXON_ID=38298 /ORGANISM="Rhodella maculata, Strain CCMP736" /LENGTH=262 /DNA_ID=CAMNT_0016159101 /DNA_START=67 /DNA_END=855 /DNA_ORIENTATION=-
MPQKNYSKKFYPCIIACSRAFNSAYAAIPLYLPSILSNFLLSREESNSVTRLVALYERLDKHSLKHGGGDDGQNGNGAIQHHPTVSLFNNLSGEVAVTVGPSKVFADEFGLMEQEIDVPPHFIHMLCSAITQVFVELKPYSHSPKEVPPHFIHMLCTSDVLRNRSTRRRRRRRGNGHIVDEDVVGDLEALPPAAGKRKAQLMGPRLLAEHFEFNDGVARGGGKDGTRRGKDLEIDVGKMRVVAVVFGDYLPAADKNGFFAEE